MCVSPENFGAHLEVLKRHAQVISLPKLEECFRSGQFPERAVALTFDDGYVDFFQHAKPLLETNELPATVFVVTGSLGRSFWWDRLIAALSTTTSLPDQPDITIAGFPLDWWLSDQNTGVNAGETPINKDRFIWSIYNKLLRIDPVERAELITEIEKRAGAGPDDHAEPLRSMTIEEVMHLDRSGLIEIGSHSASHPWLSSLPPAEQFREVSESKSVLEKILGRSVIGFSYPNGDVSQDTVLAVKQAGYEYACCSANGVVVRSRSDLFQLPRFWIQDWDGETFERWMRRWI